ncbi:hypothetical protein BaRGS_00006743 [Batillaria attramentaria]|uniref:Uncharacterized protein n=1 Tax=Batillaria attramentaria TaxID=370345 RepID=A0ABD0LS63_9CAEN
MIHISLSGNSPLWNGLLVLLGPLPKLILALAKYHQDTADNVLATQQNGRQGATMKSQEAGCHKTGLRHKRLEGFMGPAWARLISNPIVQPRRSEARMTLEVLCPIQPPLEAGTFPLVGGPQPARNPLVNSVIETPR